MRWSVRDQLLAAMPARARGPFRRAAPSVACRARLRWAEHDGSVWIQDDAWILRVGDVGDTRNLPTTQAERADWAFKAFFELVAGTVEALDRETGRCGRSMVSTRIVKLVEGLHGPCDWSPGSDVLDPVVASKAGRVMAYVMPLRP